jgi:hypothetical protein
MRQTLFIVALLLVGSFPELEAAAPANDNFADATLIAGGSYYELLEITDATIEPDEPNADNATGTVWWRWTAPVAGMVFIRTDDVQAVSIWRGSELSALESVAVDRFEWIHGPPWSEPRIWPSTLSFTVEAGTDCLIRIASPSNPFQSHVWLTLDLSSVELVSPVNGFETMEGQAVTLKASPPNPAAESVINNLVFHMDARFPIEFLGEPPSLRIPATGENGIEVTYDGLPANEYRVYATYYNSAGQLVATISTNTFIVRPANDDFANAYLVTALPYTKHFVTLDAATEEINEPVNADQFDGRSVWWRWTAPRDMVVVASGLTMGAFQGASMAELQAVGYERFATLRLNAAAGKTYHFRTTPRAMIQMPFPSTFSHFSLSEIAGNDDFANRQTLAGDEVVFTVPFAGSYEPDEPMPESPFYPFFGSYWWTWQAPVNGLLLLTAQHPAIEGRPGIFDVYMGTRLAELLRLPWELEPALPGWRKYRVLAGDDLQLALNMGTLPFWAMRLRFIPEDLPADRVQVIRAGENHISLAMPERMEVNWYLESSATLTNWVLQEVVSPGTGNPVFIGPIQTSEDKQFFRLSDTPPE